MSGGESRGLHFSPGSERFTLLLRQPEGFWISLLACLLIPLCTLELESVFLPAHQRIHCQAAQEQCVYREVQLHPFFFWQTGSRVFAIDTIDESVYADGEWELEFVDGRSLVMGSGRSAARKAETFQAFLAGERSLFSAATNRFFIACVQGIWWASFLFPFFLLYMDRHGRPRDTQSVYVDKQVVILKQYNFMGILKQVSFPVATLSGLSLEQKKHEKKITFSLMAETVGRQRPLLVDVDAQYESELRESILALQSFLVDQGIVLTVESF